MVRMTFAGWVFIIVTAFAHAGQTAGAGKDRETKSNRDEALRQELLQMVKEDQEARMVIIKTPVPDASDLRKIADIDRKNTTRMKEIIDKHGWPGKSLVGKDGANAAWLLVQHADKDHGFQKRCLPLLQRAVKAQEASAANLAYLTDRVLVGENKKQVYGTQFRMADGKWQPYPIEDEKNVDERRKEVGLPTLAEYRKTIEGGGPRRGMSCSAG
jgi:hypothetical protein